MRSDNGRIERGIEAIRKSSVQTLQKGLDSFPSFGATDLVLMRMRSDDGRIARGTESNFSK